MPTSTECLGSLTRVRVHNVVLILEVLAQLKVLNSGTVPIRASAPYSVNE